MGLKIKYLFQIRKKRRLSQFDLAELAGIAQSSLARYERGEMQPSLEVINSLARALNVTTDELINGPVSNDWELRIKISKERVIEMGIKGSSAELSIGDDAMAITLSAGYDLWEDDVKFEGLVEQLRNKRQAALKLRKEGW